MAGASEYEILLHDAEIKLARLKALYEQFFQGIEKLEPTVPRKDFDRTMEDFVRKAQPRNTALRFRLQMLVAKYGTYATYWQRVARQIEEGTYRRDVVRAQQRRLRERPGTTSTEATAADPGWDVDVDVDAVESSSTSLDFDETDVDAILGALSPKSKPPSQPTATRRTLSPFARKSIAPPALAEPAAANEAAAKSTATVTFAKPKTPVAAAPSPPRPPIAAMPKPPLPPTARLVPPPSPNTKPALPPKPPLPAVSTNALAAKPMPPAPLPPANKPSPPASPSPVVASPAAAAKAPASSDQLDASRMRKLYESYVEARKNNNERVDNVRYEALEQSVRQLIPKLREKHGSRAIDFEVVLQNGKVGLKPKVDK